MWYALATPELELKIKLEELGKVKIHEEIIPDLLAQLANQIKSDGVAKHPIIIDSRTLVVLDGMHRVAALKKLGCEYLPVCLVDYQNSNIRVGCWYRTVKGEAKVEELLPALGSLGLEVEKVSLERALAVLEAREASAALLTKEACYLLKGEGQGIKELYDQVGRIERVLKAKGLGITYETERDAMERMRAGKTAAAILTPRARKEEVVEAALSGDVFAHKTTRHVVPARPMGANVPLDWLRGDELKQANRKLIEHLRKRQVKRLPKGELFEGRRYEEELWVFE